MRRHQALTLTLVLSLVFPIPLIAVVSFRDDNDPELFTSSVTCTSAVSHYAPSAGTG